jgi:hypothetical protein
VCRNLLFEILCVHIISFEDSCQKQKKTKKKTAFCCALSTFAIFLASVLSVSLVASSIDTCLALLFNFAIIVDRANPCVECSLPSTTNFYYEQVLFHQAIAPPIFHWYYLLVAVHPCVLGKNG